MQKKFVYRFVIYLPLIIYLLADIFLFQGPLKKQIENFKKPSHEQATLENQAVLAAVHGKCLTLGQVDWLVEEYLFRRGQKREDLKSEQLKTLRLAMLNRLIDDELLRYKVQFNEDKIELSEKQIDDAYREQVKTFKTEEAYLEALAKQGVQTREEARIRIKAQLLQLAYVEETISPVDAISEDQLKMFYEANKENYLQQERFRVRHLFLNVTDRDVSATELLMDQAILRITNGESFEKVVAEISEDEGTKTKGGDLGWIDHSSRNLTELREVLLEMKIGERRKVFSKLGWHYIELLEKKDRELASFEVVKDELRAAMRSKAREEAVRNFRENLREMQKNKIRVYLERLP